MHISFRSILTASTLLFAAGSVAKPFHKLAPRGGSKLVGCYSSSDGLGKSYSYEFQSSGWCSNKCSNSAVFGLTEGSDCLCGDLLPPSSDKVDSSKCDSSCDGWPEDKCGGSGYYSVFTLKDNVGTYSSSNSTSSNNSTSTSTDNATPVVSTNSGGQTVTKTAVSDSQELDASATAENKKKSSHNTAAIAAGVVVGVVGVAALAGAAFFFYRSRKQKAQGPRNSSGYGRSSWPAMADSRFDGQFMAQRRQSNGSIDDDHDFSRRILQVTNPDR